MLAGLLAVVAVPALAVGYLVAGAWKGGEWLMLQFRRARERRVTRVESELDRTQEELRRTVLQLADALGMEAHEARKALIRESFLASGRAPDDQ